MRRKVKRFRFSLVCIALFLSSIFVTSSTHGGYFAEAESDAISTDSSILIANYTMLNGLSIRIEYLNNCDYSTPIVLMAEGLGGNKEYTSTLQNDITMQGFVTVGFSEPTNSNNKQFVLNEKNDINTLLNWIISGNLGVGNSYNICLFGQSAGGNSVLTFASDYRVNSIVGVVPANFDVPISTNTKPTAIIVGDNDYKYRNDGVSFYNNLISPKWFCDIRNGTHVLGITDIVETLPTSYTSIVENYVFAWLNYSLKADNNAYQYLTVNSTTDYNLLYVDWKLLSSSYSSDPEFLTSVAPSNPIQTTAPIAALPTTANTNEEHSTINPNSTVCPLYSPIPTNSTKLPTPTFAPTLTPNSKIPFLSMLGNQLFAVRAFAGFGFLILFGVVLLLIKNRSKKIELSPQ